MNQPGLYTKASLAGNPTLKKVGQIYYEGNKKVVPEEDIDQFLRDFYDNPETGMRGRDAMYARISAEYVGISRRRVAQWLANQETAQVHQQVKKEPITRPAVLRAEGQWAVDLTFLKRGDPAEDGELKDSQILLTVIDQFSKFGWARILPDKKGSTVAKAMKDIIKETKIRDHKLPTLVRSDNGSEFKSAEFAKVLASIGAKQRFSETYQPRHNAMVERFNKTLKGMIYRYLTQYNSSKIDEETLQKLVNNYNSTVHGTTQVVPSEVHDGNKLAAKDAHYNMRARAVKLREQNEDNYPDLEVGDKVRVARRTEGSWRRTRQLKKYSAMKQWGFEIYTVSGMTKGSPTKSVTYTVKDDQDHILMSAINKDVNIPKAFIRQDLQLVYPDKLIKGVEDREHYVVDYISDQKTGKDGKVKYLVHWLGWNDTTWEKAQPGLEQAIKDFEAKKSHLKTKSK
jgi:transposase InsO family protein